MTSPKHPANFARWIGEQLKLKSSIAILAHETGLAPETLKKYAWIANWPPELQKIAADFPDVFTSRVMIGGFASRQRFYSANKWERLRLEMKRLIQKGAGHRPKKATNYPKNRAGGSLEQQRKRQIEQKEMLAHAPEKRQEPVGFMKELSVQESLRERFATWVEVGNGEIRIKYFNTEDLDRLLEIMDGPREDLDSILTGNRITEQDALV